MAKKKSLLDLASGKLHTPAWLFWLLLAVFILRIPSFFEPYSYGDEMIYLILGEAIRRGMTLYSQVHDNKPPLLYITAALAGNLFWFKAILAIWHLMSIFVFWKLTEALFPKKLRSQQVATIVFALFTTLPLLEGNIANAEMFMIGPTTLGFFILLTQKLTFKNLFLSGVLFSTATLFKIPAMFDIPAIVFLWIVYTKFKTKDLKHLAKNTLVIGVGFGVPITLTFIYYAMQGAFQEYIVAAFVQNVGYLSSWRPGDIQEPFLARNAPLLMRGGIVFVGLVILYLKRKKLSKEFLLASSWLLLSLFAATLSERPYPHYLIQSMAPAAILVSILFTYKNYEQVFTIIPLFILVLVPNYFNFWHYPTLPYYERFYKLTTHKIDKQQYLETFGSQVPRNYKISEYIVSSTKPDEKIFVWGDSSPVYALSKRFPPTKYVADYHIKDFSSIEETIASLKADEPSIVVILPGSNPPDALKLFLFQNYNLVKTIDEAEIYKLLSPRVRALFSR